MLSNFLKPIDLQETSGNRSFYWWVFFMVAVKLWLVEAIDLLATYTPHDDYLFIKLAQHILSGNWLGPYDQVTLVKGPVYPLFIAVAHHTGMPLLLVQHLLYAAVCVVAILALRPLVKSQWLLVLGFFLLLFNPYTYTYPGTGRAFRFNLSMPLALALFSCLAGLLVRNRSTFVNRAFWSTCVGFIFSLLWYTREEGVWLLPSLGLFGLYFLFLGSNNSFQQIFTRVVLLLPIPLVFVGFTTMFSSLNEKYYGVPCIIELKSPEFQSALGGLMNISEVENDRFDPVAWANQQAAYEVSPTFKQLQPYFEDAKKGAQLPKSFYIWVLKDMVRKSGNADSLPEALAFYKKVGTEIQVACEAETIACLDRAPSIKPVWRDEFVKYIPNTFWQIITQAISFRSFDLTDQAYEKSIARANGKIIEDYRFVTREKLAPSNVLTLQSYPDYYMHMIKEKFRIMADIGNSYKLIIPFLFTLALFAHIFHLVLSIKRHQIDFASAYGFVVLSGILSLVTLLTYVKITLWGIARPLSSAYPLVIYYIVLMAICSYSSFKNKILQTEVSHKSPVPPSSVSWQ